MTPDKPVLSMADLRLFDPRAKTEGKKEARFLCPYCGADKPKDRGHACLDVNMETGLWNCKRCEKRGQLREYWKAPGGEDWKRQRADKRRRAFPTAPPKPPDPDPDKYTRYRQAAAGTEDLADTPAAAYLEARGIPADLAAAARCRYAPNWQKAGPAVVFPVWDNAGKPIAANGRRLAPGAEPKALTAGELGRGVFYTPGALEADPVAITEAPIDALTLALAGLPAIALCGTGNRPPWLIKHLGTRAPSTPPGYSRTVYLALDNDPAGDKAAAEIGAVLSGVKHKRLRPAGKDWNEDLTAGGLDALRETLTTAGVFADPPQYTLDSPDPVETGYSALFGHSGAAATPAPGDGPPGIGESLHSPEDLDPPEFAEMDPTDTSPDEVDAVESNPGAPFPEGYEEEGDYPAPWPAESAYSDPKRNGGRLQKVTMQSPTQEDPAARSQRAEALAGHIRAALAGRPLPIAITCGETIADPELYAVSEAKKAVSGSAFVSRPALDRLAALGIDPGAFL